MIESRTKLFAKCNEGLGGSRLFCAVPFERLSRGTTTDCSASGSWKRSPRDGVIYSQDAAAAMCHDVGGRPTETEQWGGHRKSTGTRSWQRKRLIQIDGGRENEAADEEMERDADRRGESDSDEERERETWAQTVGQFWLF